MLTKINLSIGCNLKILLIMWLFSPQINACETGHWIKSKTDGIVILEDNSVWEIDSFDRVDIALWMPVEQIVTCNNFLINTDTGDKVSAVQLK